MPRFIFETNVSTEKIPYDFLSTCTRTLSKLSGKSESFCVAGLQCDQELLFAGARNNEPCGIGYVSSIGGLSIEDIHKYNEVFFKVVEELIEVPRNRLWLIFTETLPESVAFKGKTFYHIVMCREPGSAIIHDPDE